MPINNKKLWNECVKVNKDSYGKACVDVAREAMRLLDTPDYKEIDDVHALISVASNNAEIEGITGFMVGCVASMIATHHSRGEDFRVKWNLKYQIRDEGEQANKSGGILNPALLSIRPK